MIVRGHSNLINELMKSGKYKVIKKFEGVKEYNASNAPDKKYIGVFLDVETTGLDIETNKIIEIALVPFEYSSDGRVFKVLDSYCAFEDPEEDLTEEIVSLTGITNEMVKGQKIKDQEVDRIVNTANLIIAHNASFDRKVVEKRFSIFKNKPWACSLTEVDWKKEEIGSAKLDYLAYKFNFFYEAHRAEVDCLVGINILAQTLPKTKELVLKQLLKNARKETHRLWAEGSPFEAKDILKKRGYKFDGAKRSWFLDADPTKSEEEIKFLQEEIYNFQKNIKIEKITAFNRFSF
ncbi:MAG: 3'-5' exonuclease [Rickettsiales bacterium]